MTAIPVPDEAEIALGLVRHSILKETAIMISRQPLCTALFLFLTCWPAINGLLAQDREKDSRSAAAVQIASRRLKAPPGTHSRSGEPSG